MSDPTTAAPQEPGFPRRSRVDLWTPAERAIYDAVQEVEKAGADERLTRAITLLGEAQGQVADYVDGVMRPAAAPQEPEGERDDGEYMTLDEFRAWVRECRPQAAHTLEWDEHPEGYDDECYCYECIEEMSRG